MPVLQIETQFDQGFQGRLLTSRAQVPIGSGQEALAPYDMLLGALASCFYATFLDIIEKKRLALQSASVRVSGEKRAEVPTTLSWVKVLLTVHGSSNRSGMEAAAELAGKYCSIYHTLSQVADMSTVVEFAD